MGGGGGSERARQRGALRVDVDVLDCAFFCADLKADPPADAAPDAATYLEADPDANRRADAIPDPPAIAPPNVGAVGHSVATALRGAASPSFSFLSFFLTSRFFKNNYY